MGFNAGVEIVKGTLAVSCLFGTTLHVRRTLGRQKISRSIFFTHLLTSLFIHLLFINYFNQFLILIGQFIYCIQHLGLEGLIQVVHTITTEWTAIFDDSHSGASVSQCDGVLQGVTVLTTSIVGSQAPSYNHAGRPVGQTVLQRGHGSSISSPCHIGQHKLSSWEYITVFMAISDCISHTVQDSVVDRLIRTLVLKTAGSKMGIGFNSRHSFQAG